MTEEKDEPIDRAEYNSRTDTYRTSYSPDELYSLTFTIVNLVAGATGKEQETMEPLFEVIDPDALEEVVSSQDGPTIRVEFEYLGCEVTALSDGEVSVTIPEGE